MASIVKVDGRSAAARHVKRIAAELRAELVRGTVRLRANEHAALHRVAVLCALAESTAAKALAGLVPSTDASRAASTARRAKADFVRLLLGRADPPDFFDEFLP